MSTQDAIAKMLDDSRYRMVSILGKSPTTRRALATGSITVGREAFELIQAHQMPKGDPLTIAEIAGVSGAKQTPALLPLCHPLPLEQVLVSIVPGDDEASYRVFCLAATFGKTGVEMEALTGVSVALLTIYDLTKIVEPALRINETQLLYKEGGKSGVWIHPEAGEFVTPKQLDALTGRAASAYQRLSASVLTISDRASVGTYEDRSGPALRALIESAGMQFAERGLVADEPEEIRQAIQAFIRRNQPDLIVTTGGTGLGPRDQTVAVLQSMFDKPAPGIAEMLRAKGDRFTHFSWLSQGVAGMIGSTLVVAMPGSTNAVRESWSILEPVLPMIFKAVRGE